MGTGNHGMTYHDTIGADEEFLCLLTEECGIRIPGTTIRPTGDRNRDRRIQQAQKSPNGEPQQFPYDNASTAVMAAHKANPGDAHLAEVAGSIRDHRESYRRGHTADCRGDLYRGFCH